MDKPDQNIFARFAGVVAEAIGALSTAGDLPADLDVSRITVEPPRDPTHGDIATNAAMVLAKPAGKKPRDLAQALADRLAENPAVSSVEVAGPGFINLRLTDDAWRACLDDVLAAGTGYGVADLGQGRPVNVEYVSANPTGPLHVGHSRGAVFGDALASLLERMGWAVTREYYINDAGYQIEQLAYSVYFRYLETFGRQKKTNVPGNVIAFQTGHYPQFVPADEFQRRFKEHFPDREWDYRGDYLIPVARGLQRIHGDGLRDKARDEWLPIVRDFAVAEMLSEIRADLEALGVKQDVFRSERALVEAGEVEAAVGKLEADGLVYHGTLDPPKGKPPPEDWEPREQLLFRATAFGDDTDRPLKKADGSWTYFATDLAYHFDKVERGFEELINVWGADHGGYVKRMKAGVAALTGGKAELDVKICQLVNLLDRGEAVKMSKRAGTFVTLREVVEEVGKDVVRFITLTRRNDAPLDFDLAKVTEQSRDNPVFYVQYAHARIRSVMRNAEAEIGADFVREALAPGQTRARLTHPAELGLIKLLAAWPRQLAGAAEAHEPHRLAFYLYDLASAFHGLWNLGKEDPGLRFLIADDVALTGERLALLEGVRLVIASGLEIFGVTPVEEMR